MIHTLLYRKNAELQREYRLLSQHGTPDLTDNNTYYSGRERKDLSQKPKEAQRAAASGDLSSVIEAYRNEYLSHVKDLSDHVRTFTERSAEESVRSRAQGLQEKIGNLQKTINDRLVAHAQNCEAHFWEIENLIQHLEVQIKNRLGEDAMRRRGIQTYAEKSRQYWHEYLMKEGKVVASPTIGRDAYGRQYRYYFMDLPREWNMKLPKEFFTSQSTEVSQERNRVRFTLPTNKFPSETTVEVQRPQPPHSLAVDIDYEPGTGELHFVLRKEPEPTPPMPDPSEKGLSESYFTKPPERSFEKDAAEDLQSILREFASIKSEVPNQTFAFPAGSGDKIPGSFPGAHLAHLGTTLGNIQSAALEGFLQEHGLTENHKNPFILSTAKGQKLRLFWKEQKICVAPVTEVQADTSSPVGAETVKIWEKIIEDEAKNMQEKVQSNNNLKTVEQLQSFVETSLGSRVKGWQDRKVHRDINAVLEQKIGTKSNPLPLKNDFVSLVAYMENGKFTVVEKK